MNSGRSALTGAAAGLFGGLLFATLHAFIIVPIWDRMGMGLVFGTITGGAAGWAFAEMRTAATRRAGAIFGAWLFATSIPATAVTAYLRANDLIDRYRTLSDAAAIVLALGVGASLGWWKGRRVHAAVSMAFAAVCLTLAMGGPVPAMRNTRAAGIYVAVLIASLAGGALLAALSSRTKPSA